MRYQYIPWNIYNEKSDHTMCEKDMKQLGPSHIAGGNGKQYNHFRTQFGGLLKS